MTDQTWDDGQYTDDDVIEAADHSGYLSVSDYVSGDNALEPDHTDGFGDADGDGDGGY
ncbi:hypothetical protein [Actinacidiphila bryophytorum]|uniref:hypothetical protein n=1 Tax=Actinacidiphila bryophytorum TaxID=1436133 RepID=UPI002176B863|nr:hypothetical protein [Actinacidiphila bryophytorum]UWE11164.1 hypothetical protein NYE86_22245 [Actinacidiphila bryophytorum]